MDFENLKITEVSDGKPVYLASLNKKLFELDSWHEIKTEGDITLIVPKGFISDLASIPSIFFFWQFGNFNISAISHDWCYIFGKIPAYNDLTETCFYINVTKREADRLFDLVNEKLNVNKITRFIMFAAVTLFGRGTWHDNIPQQYGLSIEEIQMHYLEYKNQTSA